MAKLHCSDITEKGKPAYKLVALHQKQHFYVRKFTLNKDGANFREKGIAMKNFIIVKRLTLYQARGLLLVDK